LSWFFFVWPGLFTFSLDVIFFLRETFTVWFLQLRRVREREPNIFTPSINLLTVAFRLALTYNSSFCL
jgi:hypothetical protein